MSKIIDGKRISGDIKEELRKKVSMLKNKPSLVVISVGDNEASKVYVNQKGLTMTYDRVFVPRDFDFDKWYMKEAKKIFQDELDRIYNSFRFEIPYPSLTIRKMKTRWGVCNYKTKRVTLNFNLIKKDIKYLDYVIVHELSHLLYPNHSREFWKCVEVNMPEFKEIRKDLKKYE